MDDAATTSKQWHLTLTLVEDDVDTHCRARLEVEPGRTVESEGSARRLVVDPPLPLVGEELAVARSLSAMAHRLVDHAAETLDTASAALVE